MQVSKFQLFILSVVMLCFVWSCGNDTATQQIEPVEENLSNVLYGTTSIETPKISEEVKEHTDTWGAFNDFEDDIAKVRRNTIDELKIITERLVAFSDSLSRHIPDTLNTRPIESRLKVVDTRVQLLKQTLELDRIDSLTLENQIAELAKANHNFIIGMNEKFAKDRIQESQRDQEKAELEKLKRTRDSIFKAELKDNS